MELNPSLISACKKGVSLDIDFFWKTNPTMQIQTDLCYISHPSFVFQVLKEMWSGRYRMQILMLSLIQWKCSCRRPAIHGRSVLCKKMYYLFSRWNYSLRGNRISTMRSFCRLNTHSKVYKTHPTKKSLVSRKYQQSSCENRRRYPLHNPMNTLNTHKKASHKGQIQQFPKITGRCPEDIAEILK